eukprot:2709759-Rhodomonas_salina.2
MQIACAVRVLTRATRGGRVQLARGKAREEKLVSGMEELKHQVRRSAAPPHSRTQTRHCTTACT